MFLCFSNKLKNWEQQKLLEITLFSYTQSGKKSVASLKALFPNNYMSSISYSFGPLCLVTQLCPTLCNPVDCSLSGSCPWEFSGQKCQSGLPCPPLGDLPNPGMEPRSPTLQMDSLPIEPPGKPFWHTFTNEI